MGSPQPLTSLDEARADKILSVLIGIYELIFPERIHSYYVTGSYAVGIPIQNSDLDVMIVFKEKFEDVEYEQADQLYLYLTELGEYYPDLKIIDEYGLHHPEGIDIISTVFVKGASLHVYGEDLRDKIPLPPHHDFCWTLSDVAYYYLKVARNHPEQLTIPLTHPNPDGHLLGRELTDHVDIVLTTSLVAAAFVAIKSGQYVYSKSNITKIYKELIGDAWSDVVDDVFATCRTAWGYKVPDNKTDHRKFRELCDQVLAFENAFLEDYIAYLKAESVLDDQTRRERANERLQNLLG